MAVGQAREERQGAGRAVAVVLVVGALVAPAGLAGASHASWSSQYFCNLTLALNAYTAPPGASMTATLTWCQAQFATFVTYATLYVDGVLQACQNSAIFTGGTHSMQFAFTAPSTAGVKQVYAYVFPGSPCPTGTQNTGFAHQVLTVANPTPTDTVPPVTTIALAGTAGNNGWWRSAVTVTLSATDAGSGVARTHRSVDGAPFSIYTGPFVVPADGTHTVSYYSVDNANNVEATRTAAVRIDATPPSVQASAPCALPGNAGWCRGTTTLLASASDATSGLASLACALDGAPVACGSATLAQGAHTHAATATDNAGNTATASVGFKLDSVPPATSLARGCSVPGDAGWCRGPVTYAATATDATSGLLGGATCALNGAAAPCSGTVATDGRHQVRVEAEDVAGNRASESHAVLVDATPPSGSVTTPPASVGSYTWEFAASDATSGLASPLLLERSSLLGLPAVGSGFALAATHAVTPGTPAVAGFVLQSPFTGHYCHRLVVRDVAGNGFTTYAPDYQALLGAVKPANPTDTSEALRVVRALTTVCTAKV